MQEPNTPEEIFALHRLRRADPQRFLEIVNGWLQENPRNFHAYFKRHYVWSQLGQPRRALDDLDKVIELAPSQPHFFARGMVHRQLGEHENALMDFHRGEAMGKKEWQDHAITRFSRRTATRRWAMKQTHSVVARACRTSSGHPVSRVPQAAARPRSLKSCAALRQTPSGRAELSR
jgi:tetratricopeptide (TPR) repeat protein